MTREGALIACVHGNENTIWPLLQRNYNWVKKNATRLRSICANPDAMYMGVRGIPERDNPHICDLNRRFPGDHNSSYQVDRLAAMLTDRLKGQNAFGPESGDAHDPVDFVIDIHETFGNYNLIVIDGLTPLSKELIQYFDIDHVIDLNLGQGDYSGFLISQIPGSIILEFGNMENPGHRPGMEHLVGRGLDDLLDESPNCTRQRPRYGVWDELSHEAYQQLYQNTHRDIENFVSLTGKQKLALDISPEKEIVPAFVREYSDKAAQLLELVDTIYPPQFN